MDFDRLIGTALTQFVKEIAEHNWRGRERDAISLFAFGALQQVLRNSGSPFDARQIGIEVAVLQDFKHRLGGKARVNKDLVIWGAPYLRAWAKEQNGKPPLPMAVIEWKVDSPEKSSTVPELELAEERKWLQDFADEYGDSQVFRVHLKLTGRPQPDGPRVVSFERYQRGRSESVDLKDHLHQISVAAD